MLIALALIAALLALGYLYQKLSEAWDARRLPRPGRMVDIGNYRLHAVCSGSGAGPSVVLEGAATALAVSWTPVQDEVAKFAQVCSYDRAGFGWSDFPPGPRDLREQARELHTLLRVAQLPPPYILVGHSLGGSIVQLFAREYPHEAAGMVLVDAIEELLLFNDEAMQSRAREISIMRSLQRVARFGVLRLIGKLTRRSGKWFRGLAPTQLQQAIALWNKASFWRGGEIFFRGVAAAENLGATPQIRRTAAGFGSLGNLPLVVISHGNTPKARESYLPAAWLPDRWREGQQRLVALSTDALWITAKHSGHAINLDEPQLVIEAIKQVFMAVRGGTRLTSPHASNTDLNRSSIAAESSSSVIS